MTDQSMVHPTSGRRRRRKSPSAVQSALLIPVPRLANHLNSDDVPSDEEGEKEAKRQKSEPTTPISAFSRPPNEYDEIMGITQVDPREAERFEEGIEPEFLDAEEESPKVPGEKPDSGHISSSSHRGYGSSSLQECLSILNQARSNSPAPCHSGVGIHETSNPQQRQLPVYMLEHSYGLFQLECYQKYLQLQPDIEVLLDHHLFLWARTRHWDDHAGPSDYLDLVSCR